MSHPRTSGNPHHTDVWYSVQVDNDATFFLWSAIQGITGPEHAAKIARTIVDTQATEESFYGTISVGIHPHKIGDATAVHTYEAGPGDRLTETSVSHGVYVTCDCDNIFPSEIRIREDYTEAPCNCTDPDCQV